MIPKSSTFLLIILSILVVLVPNEASTRGSIVGGWRPIENLKDPEVMEIAQFAVAEHNKEAKTNLNFVSVVQGEAQVVAGTKYRLVVSAMEGAAAASDSKSYRAVVWSKPWENFKQLLSFGEI